MVSHQKRSHHSSLQLSSILLGNFGYGHIIYHGCVHEHRRTKNLVMGNQKNTYQRNVGFINSYIYRWNFLRFQLYWGMAVCHFFCFWGWTFLLCWLARLSLRTTPYIKMISYYFDKGDGIALSAFNGASQFGDFTSLITYYAIVKLSNWQHRSAFFLITLYLVV